MRLWEPSWHLLHVELLVSAGSQCYSIILLETLNKGTIVCAIVVKDRLLHRTAGLTGHARVDARKWFLLPVGQSSISIPRNKAFHLPNRQEPWTK